MSTDTKLSLKLLVDKKANKVLFAEAGKDFVDFLFNLLSLPLGTLIRLIRNAAMVGSLGNLYESLEHLNEIYIQPNQSKDSLLNPCAPNHVINLDFSLPHTTSPEKKFYVCGTYGSSHPYVTNHRNGACPHCRAGMSIEVKLTGEKKATTSNEGGRGLVKELVKYMVTDDLAVSPMSMISGVSLLNKFNVKDFSVLEEKVVEFGINEGVELLKASLHSKSALAAVFLVKKKQDGKEDESLRQHCATL